MKYIFGMVLIFCMVACRPNGRENNIEMTEFTKELVCSYLNDERNKIWMEWGRADEIIIESYTDDSGYYLSIFSNNSREYHFCSDDYLGQTTFMSYPIKAYGDGNNMFFLINKKIKRKKQCEPDYAEYDPDVWYICLNKDTTLCIQKTHKVTEDEDLSNIQSLVDKCFGDSKQQ